MIHLHKCPVVIFTHLILFYFLKLLCVFSVLDHKLYNPRTRVQRIQCQCWILRPCWPRGLPKARYPVSFLFEFFFNHVFTYHHQTRSQTFWTFSYLTYVIVAFLGSNMWRTMMGSQLESSSRYTFLFFCLVILLQSTFFVFNTHATEEYHVLFLLHMWFKFIPTRLFRCIHMSSVLQLHSVFASNIS